MPGAGSGYGVRGTGCKLKGDMRQGTRRATGDRIRDRRHDAGYATRCGLRDRRHDAGYATGDTMRVNL